MQQADTLPLFACQFWPVFRDRIAELNFAAGDSIAAQHAVKRLTERRRQEAERKQLQNEIAQLRQALEQEKKRGFWSRLFGH